MPPVGGISSSSPLRAESILNFDPLKTLLDRIAGPRARVIGAGNSRDATTKLLLDDLQRPARFAMVGHPRFGIKLDWAGDQHAVIHADDLVLALRHEMAIENAVEVRLMDRGPAAARHFRDFLRRLHASDGSGDPLQGDAIPAQRLDDVVGHLQAIDAILADA